MSTDDFTKAARAEAERVARENTPLEYGSIWDAFVDAYAAGLRARTHLAAQEPTDAEVRAAKVALIQDEYRVAPGYELVMIRQMGREEEYDRRARAVLSAARTVQQDEEGRNG